MMPFAVGAHPQFVLQHPHHQIPMQQLTLLHPMAHHGGHGASSAKKSLHALQPILPRPSFGLVGMNMPVLPAGKTFAQLPPGVAMTNLSMMSASSGATTTSGNATTSPSLSTAASSPSMLSSSAPATPAAMASPVPTTSPTGQQTTPSPLPPQPSANAKHSAGTARHPSNNTSSSGAAPMSLSRSTSGSALSSSSSPPLASASSPPLVSMQVSTNGSPPPAPPPPPPMIILSSQGMPLSTLNRNVQLAPKYLPILPLHGPGSFGGAVKSAPMSLSTHMQLMNGATSTAAAAASGSSGSLMLAPGIRATSTAEAKMIASAASAAAAAGTSTVAPSSVQPTMIERPVSGPGSYVNGRQTSPPPSPAGRKVKPSLVAVHKLRIGEWERSANFLGEICAKFYYAKRKIAWEIMALGLMAKIEFVFSDLVSLEFYMPLDGPSILTVRLQSSPKFFGEVNPRPGRNIQWAEAEDFTGGSASNLETHVLSFPKGSLVKHYERLLTIDSRMREVVKLVSSAQDVAQIASTAASSHSPTLQAPSSLSASMPSPSLKLAAEPAPASSYLCKSCICASSYHASATAMAFSEASQSLTSPLKTSSSAMLTLSPASSSHPASATSSVGALTSPLRTSSSAMVTLSSASAPSPPTHDSSSTSSHFDGQSLHDLHDHQHHHHSHHQTHHHQHSTVDANDTNMQSSSSSSSSELSSQLLSFDSSSCSATTGMEGLYPLPLLFSSLSSSSSHGVSPMATDPPPFSTCSSSSLSSASSSSPLSPSSPFGMMMMTDAMTVSSSASSPLHLAGPPSPEMDFRSSRAMLDLPDSLMAFDLESLSSSLVSSDST